MEFIGQDLILIFITLTLLEIVLGIDNLVFISIATYKLPKKQRKKARIFGLSLALAIRIAMLFTLSWVMSLSEPVFFIGQLGMSFKDILLVSGGLFLVIKSGHEIINDVFFSHAQSQQNSETKNLSTVKKSMAAAIIQISVIDFVFSFDSVITAVAMTNNIPIIIAAILISMIIMLISAESISKFLRDYPSLKIIALALIFMVGTILLADGFHIHISKTYLYFSLFFALSVETLNIISSKRNKGIR